MIHDARVLQPEFVPRDVVHRQHEVNALTAALDPITRGEPAETVFIYGPSGTGKTCIAQYTADKLRETVLDLRYQYVNCWEDHTRFQTLYRLLEGINQTFDIHRQSTPKDQLLERLRSYDESPYVAILDEVDQLDDKKLLYDLNRIHGLELILIANQEEELYSQLDERLTSRLRTASRIHFDRYGVEELVSILEDRVRWGLQEGVISSPQLEMIADTAAGDARTAIGILRVAARRATSDELETVPTDLIQDAVSEAKSEIRQKNIEKLTIDQRILYEIITEHGEIQPNTLYSEYREQVDNPKTNRMVRNYLTKMEQYNLIRAEGENRGRTYTSV